MHEIEVFNKVTDSERPNWHLYVDAIYKANPNSRNLGGEVLSKLFSVGNQGGFRFKGSAKRPLFIALFTSGEDIYWRDDFNSELGILLYYGDQKTPGKELTNTKFKGNLILQEIFEWACSDDKVIREQIPPIFVFKKVHGRDVQFLGLAVPGIAGKPKKDWLTAVWGSTSDGSRFLNYKSYFTVLDTKKGSKEEPNKSGINLAWLTDIEHSDACGSKYAPIAWLNYIQNNKYNTLTAIRETSVKTKEEQLPPESNQVQCQMLKELQAYFIQIDRGYSFENFARDIVQQVDENVLRVDCTQPFRDGGIDAIGKYQVFSAGTQNVIVDFYLQAKCYAPFTHAVGVKDTSRLISRIKNRQFGVMVTTSYINKQAYKEIVEDGHPIVLITGKTIIDVLFDKYEIHSVDSLKSWLEREYASGPIIPFHKQYNLNEEELYIMAAEREEYYNISSKVEEIDE